MADSRISPRIETFCKRLKNLFFLALADCPVGRSHLQLLMYDNNLEYNEDLTIKKYPQVPHFWSICFSVTLEEDGRVINCLLPREVVEDHFQDDLEEFDERSIARVEELMQAEILPLVWRAIKQGRMKQEINGQGLNLEIELNVDDFEGKDFRKLPKEKRSASSQV